jgi:hypothetical protein
MQDHRIRWMTGELANTGQFDTKRENNGTEKEGHRSD